MKNLKIICVLLLVSVTISSCFLFGNAKNVTSLVRLADSVVDLVEEFADNGDNFTIYVEEISVAASTGIDEDKDILDVAKFWEKYWDRVRGQRDDLNYTLNKIKSKSDQYFQELAESTNSISDSELRAVEKQRNQDLRSRWYAEYEQAVKSMNEVEILMQEGEDFLRVISNQAMRSRLEETIPQLQNISEQAKVVASNISTFKSSAREIFINN